MRTIFWFCGIVLVIGAALFYWRGNLMSNTETIESMSESTNNPVRVIPLMHATGILEWSGTNIYFDPTGGEKLFSGQPNANIVLLTDIHGDHLSTSTLAAVVGSATLIVPQAVKDMLPPELAAKAEVLSNDQSIDEQGCKEPCAKSTGR